MVKIVRNRINSRIGAWITGTVTGAALAVIGLTMTYSEVSDKLAHAGLEQFLKDLFGIG